jgi:hypothetical protein
VFHALLKCTLCLIEARKPGIALPGVDTSKDESDLRGMGASVGGSKRNSKSRSRYPTGSGLILALEVCATLLRSCREHKVCIFVFISALVALCFDTIRAFALLSCQPWGSHGEGLLCAFLLNENFHILCPRRADATGRALDTISFLELPIARVDTAFVGSFL